MIVGKIRRIASRCENTHHICHHFFLNTAFSTEPMSSCFNRKSVERAVASAAAAFSWLASFSTSARSSLDIDVGVGESEEMHGGAGPGFQVYHAACI